ncbi:MAG: hypothetical protein IH906_07210, partial [Proteobacteria bacterium]|nr:hypothetical protein [Pseudomonadota bacterium]
MSRLDSVIRRLRAQRDCLDVSVRLVADVPGPVLEFGLGNGRTYDHLRTLFPDREIFVFDRRIAAHPDCVPDAAHMLLGDFDDTMPGAGARIGARAALAHFDVGSPDAAANGALGERLVELAAPLLAPGGVVVSDLELLAS